MTTRQQSVTPDMATTWLEGNTHNRSLRQSTVERYARDMREGNWRLTHQGLAFADDTTLIDGQHRLWAVIESGRTIEFMVTRGLPRDAQEYIDGGEKRTTTDVLNLRGEKASPLIAGIAMLLAKQITKTTNPTRSEQVSVYDTHKDAINFAVGAFTRNVRGIRTARVLTPIARASYSWLLPELLQFSQVLCDGVSVSRRDSPTILLRNWLLERNPKRMDIYGKTERALMAYLNEEQVRILYASTDELFPLPEERDAVKAKPKRRR